MVAFVALALTAALATSGPDSIARIPGSTMSLGMPEARIKEVGTFVEVKTDAEGAVARRGDAKFFGVPCSATLYLRDGRLERVRFEVASVAPHSAAYVEDQLLRSRLLRECRRLEPGNHDCDWIGKVKIHLELLADKLTATADWPQRPWEAEAEAPAAAATVARPDAAAIAKRLAALGAEPPSTAGPAKEHATAEPTPAKVAETAPAKPPETTPAKAAETALARVTDAAPAKPPETVPAKATDAAPVKPPETAPAKATDAAPAKPAESSPTTTSAGTPLPTAPPKPAPATITPVPAPTLAMPSPTQVSAPAPSAPKPPPTVTAPAEAALKSSTTAPATPKPAAKSAPAAAKPAASKPTVAATAPAGGTVAAKTPLPTTPMLPETLRLSLPERNPPSVWPRMLALPALDYPEAARSKGVQGVVWVLALVDTAGEVRSTRIDRGIPGLNESALAWVTQAHFAPCVREGATLSFWIRVAVRFTLS